MTVSGRHPKVESPKSEPISRRKEFKLNQDANIHLLRHDLMIALSDIAPGKFKERLYYSITDTGFIAPNSNNTESYQLILSAIQVLRTEGLAGILHSSDSHGDDPHLAFLQRTAYSYRAVYVELGAGSKIKIDQDRTGLAFDPEEMARLGRAIQPYVKKL